MTTKIEPTEWVMEYSEDELWYYDLIKQEENNTLDLDV